ncbi:hypothetical protein EV193_102132 [Herbihabitans rhizosphaerae]|uniref:Dirigent-like protein n=1 Tax=Herbihabitans rhizosphaerae TaxID=1872711 RepID=A0A4Q7L250_9PSEU|nr:hypothetical protein [Herbihabitans rhizosphaerae]RZS43156.1 hypothetical protein EV193_102132 [Herbihabitans rhizosphaerae]
MSTTMRRTLAVGITGVAAAALLTAASAPASGDSPRDTLELVAKRTVFSVPQVPAVGIGFIGGGDLFDSTGVNKVGEGYSSCAIAKLGVEVPPTFTAQCGSTYRLADGELHLSSLRQYKAGQAGFNEGAIAILGGTGKYATARGEGKSAPAAPGKANVGYRFTFTIVTG